MLSVCFIFISYFWPARMSREHDAITPPTCLGHERTTSLDWPPGAPQPVHGPGPYISPLVSSAGMVSSSPQCCLAMRPTKLGPPGGNSLSPSPGRHLTLWAEAPWCPQLSCSWLEWWNDICTLFSTFMDCSCKKQDWVGQKPPEKGWLLFPSASAQGEKVRGTAWHEKEKQSERHSNG